MEIVQGNKLPLLFRTDVILLDSAGAPHGGVSVCVCGEKKVLKSDKSDPGQCDESARLELKFVTGSKEGRWSEGGRWQVVEIVAGQRSAESIALE